MSGRKAALWLMLLLVIAAAGTLVAHGAAMPESGQSRRVFDDAGLLDSDRQAALEEQIAAARKEMRMDLVLVTTDQTGGLSSEEYADWYYENGGFGEGTDHRGALLLLDMENRELYISTEGAMIRFLTDSRIETMLDHGIVYMQQQDYGAAAEQLVADTLGYYRQGIPGGQYNYDRETGAVSRYRSIRWYEALLALAVSGFCGAGACLKVKKDYAMKQEQRQAANYLMAYRAGAQFQFQAQNDALADQYVVQSIIPRSTGGGGRGGGSQGGGGRSTTHTSAGGRTHGGGGRRF